ncbi:hypothetical protein MASR1M36_14620 [Candidatus Cloacimonadaceae bacterium]
MKKIAVIIGALYLGLLWGGNSIFSYQGFPVRYYGKDIYSLGMGDTGASDIFRYNTGYANPAMHNRDNKTLFGTGLMMGYTIYDSELNGEKQNFWDDALDFPYFNISVPVGKHRLGAQFSPHSSGLVSNQTLLSSGGTEEQTADKYLYKADLIYSANMGTLNLGVSGNLLFGHDKRYFYQSSGFGGFNTRESLIKDFKGQGVTVGILKSFEKLSLGAHYSLPVNLQGESVRSSIHETEASVDYEYKLPAQYNLSFTALPYEQFKLAADLSFEPWSDIDSYYRNSLKAGLGIAYEPDPELHKTAFMRLPMRIGASYRQLEFKDKDGNEIDELGLSCGLTFPLKREVNRIDMGFQYLKRGDLGSNKLSDTSFMFLLGFTGFDLISRSADRTAPRSIPQKEEM